MIQFEPKPDARDADLGLEAADVVERVVVERVVVERAVVDADARALATVDLVPDDPQPTQPRTATTATAPRAGGVHGRVLDRRPVGPAEPPR